MTKIWKILRLLRHDLVVLLVSLRHADTPATVKGGAAAALLYLLAPTDIVPDAIPFIGLVDDLIIVPLTIEGLLRFLPEHVREESERKAIRIFRYLPLVVILATLTIIGWVILVIWGGYSLITAIFA